MDFGKRLQRWWDELLGRPRWYRDADGRTPQSRTKPAGPAARAGLTFVDGSAIPPPAQRARSRRSAGMDPYANDAGFAKPHSWERIDHD